MSTIVVMPGGFHPFHAGHAALYNSARRAFPDAEVFVAATNDTSTRPFPFAVKEKLAKLAGVEPGHFVQVKSPFQVKEITANFNPEQDRLIFVRSEKDADKPPQAGGVKKDGQPAYLQPLLGAKRLEPFGKHAYMAYLPTVEFGPGMTSATEIRGAWPHLNEKRKTALVMSLYPATQKNPALAANVVKMLDTAMGGELDEDLSRRGFLRGLGAAAVAGAAGNALAQSQPVDVSREFQNMRRDDPRIQHNKDIDEMARAIYDQMVATRGQPIDRRQQQMWMTIAREKAAEKLSKYAPGRPAQQSQSSGFPAQGSERRVSRNIDNFEDLNEFAPGGNSASSYYAVTANFVNEFAQQKQEELQDLIDAGWTKQDLAQAGTLQGQAADIAHFKQVRDGFLKGLKPGFDAYLRGDTQMKDQLGEYWIENDLPLNQDWENIYGEPWGDDGLDEASALSGSPGTQGFVGGMYANYQARENQPVSEDYIDEH